MQSALHSRPILGWEAVTSLSGINMAFKYRTVFCFATRSIHNISFPQKVVAFAFLDLAL